MIAIVPGWVQRAWTSRRLSGHSLHQLLESKWFKPLGRVRSHGRRSHVTETQSNDLKSMDELLGELHDEVMAQSGDQDQWIDCLLI